MYTNADIIWKVVPMFWKRGEVPAAAFAKSWCQVSRTPLAPRWSFSFFFEEKTTKTNKTTCYNLLLSASGGTLEFQNCWTVAWLQIAGRLHDLQGLLCSTRRWVWSFRRWKNQQFDGSNSANVSRCFKHKCMEGCPSSGNMKCSSAALGSISSCDVSGVLDDHAAFGHGWNVHLRKEEKSCDYSFQAWVKLPTRNLEIFSLLPISFEGTGPSKCLFCYCFGQWENHSGLRTWSLPVLFRSRFGSPENLVVWQVDASMGGAPFRRYSCLSAKNGATCRAKLLVLVIFDGFLLGSSPPRKRDFLRPWTRNSTRLCQSLPRRRISLPFGIL